MENASEKGSLKRKDSPVGKRQEPVRKRLGLARGKAALPTSQEQATVRHVVSTSRARPEEDDGVSSSQESVYSTVESGQVYNAQISVSPFYFVNIWR